MICVMGVFRQLLFQREPSCGIFGSDCEYVIPFECIKKAGSDIIMVEISEEKCLKGCKE